VTKLNDKKIRWLCRHVVDIGDKTTRDVSDIYDITMRRAQQLLKFYNEYGQYPTLNMKRRPRTHLTEEQKCIIVEAHNECFLGARLLRYHIKRHYGVNIPQNKIHKHLLEVGLAKTDPKKQKKRKRCRYERKHSLSLVHADWLDHDGSQVIAYEDDASRRVISIGEFISATTENAIQVLKEAEALATNYCGCILAINTDRGTQFYASGGEKKKKGISQFERYLKDQGIKHIPSRRNNPQTNGKIERWFQEYLKHRHRFDTAQEFMEWYNNRIHGALKLEWGETPNEAFMRKMRAESLIGMFFKSFGRED